jgi:hypothetical protein
MLARVGGSALVLAFLLGCAGGQTGSSSSGLSPAPLAIATVAGDYALVAVDGHALPYTPASRGNAPVPELVSGIFLLNSNGTFRLQTVFKTPEADSDALAFSGTCYTEGNEVKMAWDGGGLTNIMLRGDTVLLKREGALYAYLRRP